MVEVFKTDVRDEGAAKKIIAQLRLALPDTRVTFDLEDCDHVLRIASPRAPVDTRRVMEVVTKLGHAIDVLE